MNYEEVIARLEALKDIERAKGAEHFGIKPTTQFYGIAVPDIRDLAKEIKTDHALAEKLWESGIHEGRLLATMIDDPKEVTEEQMERWVSSFDTWDVCDQCCGNLFDRTPYAYSKAVEWSQREEEFVKRAAFALMAWAAVHDKKAADSHFENFLPIIQRESNDDRNFVKKAVNWALRQIGKRNKTLNKQAIETAERIQKLDSKAAKWIASDALRELRKGQGKLK
jgi:3-methyladenine DNA glycosylase AlkD